MAKILVDISVLRRYPKARRIILGYSLTQTGGQITAVVLALQVFEMTRSVFDVGLISFVQIAPTFLSGLVAGSLADARNRKALLITADTFLVCGSGALAVSNAFGSRLLWLIYLLSAINAIGIGIDAPTRMAVLMSLVDKDSYISAASARQLTDRTAYIVGPSLAGIIASAFGLYTAYGIDVGAAVVALIVVATIGRLPAATGTTAPGFRSVAESFRFVRQRQAVQACFFADLNAMVLGMPTALFPAIALVQFHGGARDVGLMFAAPGAGALLLSFLSGWSTRVRRPGVAVCVAVACWGAAITAFGFMTTLGAALTLLAVAGAADTVSVLFLSTIIQVETPDDLRGRVATLQSGILGNGPRLGGVESGIVASLGGVQTAVVSGGLGCIAGVAVIARLMPALLRYRFDDRSMTRLAGSAPGEDLVPPPPGATAHLQLETEAGTAS